MGVGFAEAAKSAIESEEVLTRRKAPLMRGSVDAVALQHVQQAGLGVEGIAAFMQQDAVQSQQVGILGAVQPPGLRRGNGLRQAIATERAAQSGIDAGEQAIGAGQRRQGVGHRQQLRPAGASGGAVAALMAQLAFEKQQFGIVGTADVASLAHGPCLDVLTQASVAASLPRVGCAVNRFGVSVEKRPLAIASDAALS